MRRKSYGHIPLDELLSGLADLVVPGVNQRTQDMTDDIEKRLNDVLGNDVHVGPQYVLGVLERNDSAIYLGFMDEKKTGGQVQRAMYVVGLTLVHGWPLTVTEYAAFSPDMAKLQALLGSVKRRMTKIVAANSLGV